MFYYVYYDQTDDCTYCYKEILGYAKTEIGAIKIEDKYKKLLPDTDIYIAKENFIEELEMEE